MIINNDTWCVYSHINTINGKMYVGITSNQDNPNRRWMNGFGYRQNKHFHSAIQKYGWDSFDHQIIASNLTKEQAQNMQKIIIDKLNLTDRSFGYNKMDGGTLPPHMFGQNHPNYGKVMSEQVKNNISKSLTGKKGKIHSKETKDKIALSHMGPKYRKTLCVQTGQIFNTAKQAAEFIGCSKSAITKSVKTGGPICGNHWRYLNSVVCNDYPEREQAQAS